MKPVSVAEVKKTLTAGGVLPLQCSFTAGGLICRWSAGTRLKVLKGLNDEIYHACLDYLCEEGRQFRTLDEAIEVAIRDKWPHWENLLSPFGRQ